jgi:hypothetical protein
MRSMRLSPTPGPRCADRRGGVESRSVPERAARVERDVLAALAEMLDVTLDAAERAHLPA